MKKFSYKRKVFSGLIMLFIIPCTIKATELIGSGNGTGSGTSGTPPSTTTSVFFGLMEIDFGLPISLDTGRLVFEIEPGYVLPMFTDPSIPNPEGFSMMCNLYIKIL